MEVTINKLDIIRVNCKEYNGKFCYSCVALLDNGYTTFFNCSEPFYNVASKKLQSQSVVHCSELPCQLKVYKGQIKLYIN